MAQEAVHSFVDGANGRWKLRDQREVASKVKEWRRVYNAGEMQAAGVNKLEWALQEKYFPGINFANVAPQDIMHLFADGVTRNEAAWLIYMLHSRGHLPFEEANAAIHRYGWSRDCRVPQMPDCVKNGETGNYPRSDATLHMSASQTFAFSIHRRTWQSSQY
jgi:hypothetical protein